MLRYVLLLTTAILLSMCASSKRYTLEELPEKRLYFTFGGGFTGEYQEYMVFPNGQLFHRKRVISELPYREYDPIDAKVAKDLFETYEKQEIAKYGYDNPGNMTYTIMAITESDSTSITWGGSEVKPDETVKTYWRRVMQEVSDKKPLPADK